MKLQYKTRGMSNPQGKQKVYFAAHPSDYSLYFERLSGDVLKCQDCSVWYDEEPAAEYDREAYESILQEMVLMVIPVTARFLKERNRALDVDFAYAVEHHIPVLPIMEEEGLENLFNQVCGDLQFLDPNAQDETAISYEEKLQKFLESILVGEELLEQIRQAFDAYIFMSYRKKDRAYAKELMRLIHRNDFCRDIAIWYDEYLTPGEDFNEAIGAALQKSGLFAMVVTPNLVNEDNYVMKHEYPMAKDCRKLIVPVEMQATDRDMLHSKYDEDLDCVDGNDEAQLAGRLLDVVKQMGLREQNSSPEHRFFIGLAYLGGIDVEKDSERAIGLIRGAAEEGLLEAMRKLVSVYQNGEGVARDYKEALRWQERIADVWREAYRSGGGEGAARQLVEELFTLNHHYNALRMYEASQTVVTEADAVSSNQSKENPIVYWKRAHAIAAGMLGSLYKNRGQYDEAAKYYRESIPLREEINEELNLEQTRRELIIIYNNAANLEFMRGAYAEAIVFYDKAFRVAEVLMQENGSREHSALLSTLYMGAGTCYRNLKRYEEARNYIEKSIRIGETLLDENETLEMCEDVANTCHHMALMCMECGQMDEAESYFVKSIALSEKVAEESRSITSYEKLAGVYHNMGYFCRKTERLEQAKAWIAKSIDIEKELVKECGMAVSGNGLAVSYSYFGELCYVMGLHQEAVQYYQSARDVRKQMTEGSFTVENRRMWAKDCYNTGFLYQILEEDEKAIAMLTQCIDILEQLSYEQRGEGFHKILLKSYERMADLMKRSGRFLKARKYRKKAEEK